MLIKRGSRSISLSLPVRRRFWAGSSTKQDVAFVVLMNRDVCGTASKSVEANDLFMVEEVYGVAFAVLGKRSDDGGTASISVDVTESIENL